MYDIHAQVKILCLLILISDTSENSSALHVVNVERNRKIIYTWKVNLSWSLMKIFLRISLCVCLHLLESLHLIFFGGLEGLKHENLTGYLEVWAMGKYPSPLQTKVKSDEKESKVLTDPIRS